VTFFGDILTMTSLKWRYNWFFEVRFCHNHLEKQNLVTSRNFRLPKPKIKGLNMLKMRIFWKKYENRRTVGALPPDSRVVTPSCYFNMVGEGVSSTKIRFVAIEKVQNKSNYVLHLLLSHFCTYFLLQTLWFMLARAQEYFLLPGASRVHSLRHCRIILVDWS